jgi:hypothetical protein
MEHWRRGGPRGVRGIPRASPARSQKIPGPPYNTPMDTNPPPSLESQPWKKTRKGRIKPKLDAVYCLALNDHRDGIPCYKLGATSITGRGLWSRVANIRAGSKMQVVPLLWAYVGPDTAPQLEKQILAMGRKTDHTGWQGHNEVRALTDDELQQVLNLIKQAEIPFPV